MGLVSLADARALEVRHGHDTLLARISFDKEEIFAVCTQGGAVEP